jgi:predicted Zn-dependent protease
LKRSNSFQLFLGLLAVSSAFSIATRAASSSDFEGSVGIEAAKSYSRFSISIDSSFKPVISETANGFTIVIPAATLMDVGVPFGSEEAFNRYLSTLKDSRLSNIRIHEDESKLVIEGKYKFPVGSAKLANPAMEHFDFRKEELGKFFVDFFYKKGPTALEFERSKKIVNGHKSELDKDAMIKREAERKESREKRLVEARNALFFCELPFDRSNTVFLRYRADHPVVKFSSYFPEKIPDHLFEYTEPKSEGEEADMVRLALKLARENKEALSIKTVEFLQKQYQKSRFLNEMLFLKANDLYRLGFEDKGREMLVELAKRAKGTEVALQSAAFLAVQSFDKKEWLAALEGFMDLKSEMPKAKLAWLFHYGIAESLYEIKQADQAKVEYQWLAKNAPKEDVRAEGAFKTGDVSFDRNQYGQAVLDYESAIKKFPDELSHYPQVLMNLAESYFDLEEFARSEEMFKKYMDYGRNQPNAWRASLRLAEIKSLHQKMSPEIEAAFTETVNSYPMSPGTVIARLRMLPCGTHGGFDLASFTRFINSPEVKNFDGDGTLFTEPFSELVALTEVRTLLSFGQDEKAVTEGLAHLRENPSMEGRRLIEQAMIGGIKRVIEKELNAGDEIAAINTYQKYGDYLPMPLHDPMADDLKMRVAKAASERKLTSLAMKIIEPYRKLSEVEAKEVMAAIEKNLVLEGLDQQEDRVYLEITTLWNGADFQPTDEKQAADLLSRLKMIRERSPYSFERDLILALFYSETKDFARANELNLKLTTRMSKLGTKARAQVWTFAAETANAAQDFDFAEKAFHQARLTLEKPSDKDQPELGLRHLSTVPTLSYLYEKEGEILEKQENWKEAVALYTEAIENKVGGNHILYAQARALLKTGGRESRKIASRSLEKIEQSQDDDVWKRLARETLAEIAKEGKVDDKRNQ